MFKFLKKIKIQFCCGSKCVINDTNNDGIPDEIKYKSGSIIQTLKPT